MSFGCTFVVLLCVWVVVTSANTLSDGPDEVSVLKEQVTKLRQQIEYFQTNLVEQMNSELQAKISEQMKILQTEQEEQTKSLQSEQQQQQRELNKLFTALLDDKQDQLGENHMIKRRAVIGGAEKIDIDDLLRRLPIETLKSLLKGRDGRDGSDGKDGATGPAGPTGAKGSAGRDGVMGLPGVRGPSGSPGEGGTSGSPGAAAESAGAIYTRWGRTKCGEQSSLLYKGFAGRSEYNHGGGGVNYQCMPLNPEYNRYYRANGGRGKWRGSWMSGVEYQSDLLGIFPDSAHDQNAPCARCYTNNRSAVMMVPGKRTCPTYWSKEYEGYLMTDQHDNQSATYECVDAKPEYVQGQKANTNGALFYFVRVVCGHGDHCPPYDGEKSLTCVVCSR